MGSRTTVHDLAIIAHLRYFRLGAVLLAKCVVQEPRADPHCPYHNVYQRVII
jgi:hypothetical protein